MWSPRAWPSLTVAWPGPRSLGRTAYWLLEPGAGPLAFVLLLLLCNVQPRRNLPVIFEHDAWFIIFMAAFASPTATLPVSACASGPSEWGVWWPQAGPSAPAGDPVAEESGKRETPGSWSSGFPG